MVNLTVAERETLLQLIDRGKPSARKVGRALILLHADAGWPEGQISQVLNIGILTVGRVQKRFVEEGLADGLSGELELLGQFFRGSTHLSKLDDLLPKFRRVRRTRRGYSGLLSPK